jgi:hypothetical protein
VLAVLTGGPPGHVAAPVLAAAGLSVGVAGGPLWLARRRRAGFDVG